ncbi:MAG: LysM peptidoglycan-binding domain-containing protein [Anaerolineae bacterium]|jgi:LasA protease|nr:LysM peptidoglycan-binding domain-containing protein [Anaerolineae bacterium]MBT7073979.1 LysM peptidoglycan-binding domain-containing protein [Anaerolineae bacterium]MBT7783612.1 LysM peptidoglycan-binding domain-containing protein [Anaerolineae bacterium]
MKKTPLSLFITLYAMLFFLLTSCAPVNTPYQFSPTADIPIATSTPYASRPEYTPGELVAYTAQTGDTIPGLAGRFNTSEAEILAANSIIPHDVSTLPPGMPMEIPIYYLPLWGSQFQILPDSAFVNGPAASDFHTETFVDAYPGWLRDYEDYVGGKKRSGAEIVDYVAYNFSVSPRLLLALLEYQAGALTKLKEPNTPFTLGYEDPMLHSGMYLQLIWAANILNNGYYGWRGGNLLEFERADGYLERPDPWQNAATVGIQYYFSRTQAGIRYEKAIGAEGLFETYIQLFGSAEENPSSFMPGSLEQPEFLLPFPREKTWTYTGAPHTGWGTSAPFAAIDFAPPSERSGCFIAKPEDYATAVATGMVTRVDQGVVILDLDLDGDERTGWSIFYLHIAASKRAQLGAIINAGESIGYPSCEGGTSTGTHIHIARKYNGEWILADSPLPFNLEGWIAHNGTEAYEGTLSKNGVIIQASIVSENFSRITTGK